MPVFKKRCKGKRKLTIYLYIICCDLGVYCIFTFRMLRMNIYFAIAAILTGISCTTEQLPPKSLPKPDHIVVLIFENHDYQMILDTSAADYLHTLMLDPQTAHFTESTALGHPSQPNYIMLFSGDNQGVETNDRPAQKFTTPNLAAQLVDAGLTFVTYSEDLPYAGFDGDVSGKYVRRHNPLANWMGTGKNQVDSLLNQPLTAFPTDFNLLPTISFVVPNLDNDMHDGSIAQGDDWLKTNFEAYINWAKENNSLCIITFDEGNPSSDVNQILTLFIGANIIGGEYNTPINHFSVLSTLQQLYDLPHSGFSKMYYPIMDCWEK